MAQQFENGPQKQQAEDQDEAKSLGGWRKWVMLAVVCASKFTHFFLI